jgi:inorganic pyrophosphatase
MTTIEVGEIYTNDQGEELEVLAVANIEGTEYVAVGFVEDIQEAMEEDIDIFFLKVNQGGDFTAIESDEDFDQVSSAFDELMKED